MQFFTDSIKPVLLNVGHSEPDACWNWSNIRSPFARIYYVTGGSASTTIEGTEYELLPGRLYLTPPFALHHDRSYGHFSLYYIHFYEDTGGRRPLFDLLDMPVAAEAQPGDGALIGRLLEINPGRHLSNIDPEQYDNKISFSQNLAENRRMPLHTAVETQGILCQLLSRFIGRAAPKERCTDEKVYRCLIHIHENLDLPLRVSELAEMCCVTADYLGRIFRRETGCAPTDYIHRKKMEKAELMILTSEAMVKDIAGELSIDNVSYFNRLFKRHTGLTPVQYRKANSSV